TFEVLDGLVVVVIANATTTLSGVLIPPWRHRAQEIGAKLRLRVDSRSRPPILRILSAAGWSSLVARRAHNPKVVGSNPAPANLGCRTPAASLRGGRCRIRRQEQRERSRRFASELRAASGR